MDELSGLPLLCIHGPAGCGKSMLVASYLAHHKLPSLWYRVDSGDADAATIFSFLTQGASAISRKQRLNLPVLAPEHLLDLASFTRRFLRVLFAALPPRCSIVFDGVESAEGDALLHLLGLAVEEIPEGQRVIVTNREAPAPAHEHFLVRGLMGTIGWAELRLTVEEATAIAARYMTVPDRIVVQLHAAADGWAAGFVLLLAHWRRTGDEAAGSDEEVTRQLFPYYVNELFSRIDDATRQFLMRTSLLDAFSRDQATSLAPHPDVDSVLNRLLRGNFFIERSAGPKPVHRYHPLFLDFLRRQARQLLPLTEYRELQHRASDLLLADGESEAAVSLLIEAQSWDRAATLISALAPSLLRKGRLQTVLGLTAAIPPTASQALPWLSFWRGMALMALSPPQSRSLLEVACSGFVEAGDRVGELLATGAVLDSYFHQWGDLQAIDPWADRLLLLLTSLDGRLPPEVEVRALSSAMVLMFRGHRHDTVVTACCQRCLQLLPRIADVQHRMLALSLVLMVRYLRGEWAAGLAFVAHAEDSLPDASVAPLHVAVWHALKARLQVWSGNCEKAFSTAAFAERLAADQQLRLLASITASAGAFAALNADDTERAAHWFDRMKAVVLPTRLIDVATVAFQEGLICMARDHFRLASENLRAGVDQAADSGAELLAAQFRIALAQSLIGMGRGDDAEVELQRVAAYADAADLNVLHHGALMTRAWRALRADDVPKAIADLRGALTLGREFGHRMVFPWAPLSMLQDLGCLALEMDVEKEQMLDMITLRKVPPPSPGVEQWPWPVRIFALGRFEVLVNSAPLKTSAKAPKKPLELLKALLATGTEGAAVGSLVQQLWPDLDGANAQNAFSVTLHRLRKLLNDEQALVLRDSRLVLDKRRVWTDLDVFRHLTDLVADEVRAPSAQRLLSIYQGDLLPDDEMPWVLGPRERLRMRLNRSVAVLADRLERSGQFELLVDLQRRMIELDPLAESMYRGLMLSLHALGRVAEALDVYERCRELLNRTLGMQPSPLTEQARRQIESRSW